jgi:hypothetical protein
MVGRTYININIETDGAICLHGSFMNSEHTHQLLEKLEPPFPIQFKIVSVVTARTTKQVKEIGRSLARTNAWNPSPMPSPILSIPRPPVMEFDRE